MGGTVPSIGLGNVEGFPTPLACAVRKNARTTDHKGSKSFHYSARGIFLTISHSLPSLQAFRLPLIPLVHANFILCVSQRLCRRRTRRRPFELMVMSDPESHQTDATEQPSSPQQPALTEDVGSLHSLPYIFRSPPSELDHN